MTAAVDAESAEVCHYRSVVEEFTNALFCESLKLRSCISIFGAFIKLAVCLFLCLLAVHHASVSTAFCVCLTALPSACSIVDMTTGRKP